MAAILGPEGLERGAELVVMARLLPYLLGDEVVLEVQVGTGLAQPIERLEHGGADRQIRVPDGTNEDIHRALVRDLLQHARDLAADADGERVVEQDIGERAADLRAEGGQRLDRVRAEARSIERLDEGVEVFAILELSGSPDRSGGDVVIRIAEQAMEGLGA